MDIICIDGPTPGRIVATLTHGGEIKHVPMELARHGAGGWQARLHGGDWGLRCHAAATAVLLEAGNIFGLAEERAPAMELAAD